MLQSPSVEVVERAVLDNVLDCLEDDQERAGHYKQKNLGIAVQQQDTVDGLGQMRFNCFVLN